MIQIKTLEVAGIGPAIHAMRNPYDSWEKSDTHRGKVGKADRELSEKLRSAGGCHCKHLRMIVVWAEIQAPLYWWKEFDTYRMGVEKSSCSTMHTITKRAFCREMFTEQVSNSMIADLEEMRKLYLSEDDPMVKRLCWERIIQTLPNGFIQRRTVMVSYAALSEMYKWRKGHKLHEWHVFREWCETLPEAELISNEIEQQAESEADYDE